MRLSIRLAALLLLTLAPAAGDLETAFETVELVLTLERVGDQLLPHGQYRLDDGPLLDLSDNIFNDPPDGGALALADPHGASLVATPEPASALLVALGLAGAGLARRRRESGSGRMR